MNDPSNRRPLKSRQTGWAQGLARVVARLGISPDAVSFMSLVFATIGADAFALSRNAGDDLRIALLVGAGVAIQLRLICNLIDGMVAVEHGKGGPHGPIWNELPDRLSDALLMAGAGVGASAIDLPWGLALGLGCGLLAVLTAYVRELGRGLGLDADFAGPMAKPQRMALLTLAAVVSATEGLWGVRGWTLVLALAAMALLTAVTVARRTLNLAKALEQRAREKN